ncbi:UDP-2,4-diacetamido-2,4,6-trideoxy-beta-L-altropyranose hydrolase [Celerinatantimonas sp. YJH-8]|uniref:UDP-2,4-diacetamido-2,4, 6-trideoxy-beta-L-altropyranose hydrolase n=1 Tax=Celerinatantimonas sp. YJH-8 TaxID=3228714 RepID=UPI0038C7131A
MLKILFRLDASTAIGTGHLMRMLTLANALTIRAAHTHQHVRCSFYCYQLSAPLQALIAQSGHQYLSADALLADVQTVIDGQADWVIVDHYQIDQTWESQVRRYAKVLVIDDLADRTHDADALLDQGPLRTPDDYQPWINADCQLLLGPDYALIGEHYRHHRQNMSRPFARGLVCFGGADPVHATLRTLQSLDQLPQAMTIDWLLIAGAANPDWEKLQQFCAKTRLKVTLKRHESEMPSQLAAYDFTIGAAGGMTWERCCIGIPTLAVAIVDNQVFNESVIARYQLAQQLTLAQLANPAMLASALEQLEWQREGYRQRSQAMIDGLGAIRIADFLLT